MDSTRRIGLLLLLTCGVAVHCYHVPFVPPPPRVPPPLLHRPISPYNNGYDPDLRPPPPPPYPGPQQPWGYQESKSPWYGYPPNYNQIGGRPPPPQGGYINQPYPTRPNVYGGLPPSGYGNGGIPPVTTTPEPITPKPVEAMADVVNHLGTRILLDHVSTRGNFAFSPYGATSVLCVLTEGAAGNSVRQLVSTLDLPSDPGTVRVGMRDMHRHLKSYFGHNGFLEGVDLSSNRTSLRSDFLPVLRLYGYHVDDQMETTTMAPSTTTTDGEQSTTEGAAATTVHTPDDSDMDGSDNQELVSSEAPSTTMEPEHQAMVSDPSLQEVTIEPDEIMTMEPEGTSEQPEEGTSPQPEPEPSTEQPGDDNTTPADEATAQPEEEENEASARRRRRRSADKHVLFPDIALATGLENSSKIIQPDHLTPRRPFRLFSGTFTRPVPVLERREFLPFASLPQLRAVAALLPLDEPRYGLLVLLPTDGRGPALVQLARELTEASLRRVLDALRPSRVHATIPVFTARGPVVLTSSLQQLGIWDVFDPRLARLERMSTDPGLYVRELEQNVHVDFGSVRSVNTRVVTARSAPEVLDAMRPFLYFVLDRETHTALLAGKVEDPSTPRIF